MSYAEALEASKNVTPQRPSNQLQLHYFDVNGRAEPMRMLLNHAGVPFNDVRLQQSDWPNTKYTSPYDGGSLPIAITGDKKVLKESTDILRYFGRMCGYYPTDATTAMICDNIIDNFKESCFDAVVAPIFAV